METTGRLVPPMRGTPGVRTRAPGIVRQVKGDRAGALAHQVAQHPRANAPHRADDEKVLILHLYPHPSNLDSVDPAFVP